MNATEATLFLDTLIALPDAAGSKAAVVAISQAAGLPAEGFVTGDPAERTEEVMGRAMGAWNVVPQQAAKAVFFALATDPGDVDDFGTPDQSADQTPRPGFLSAHGVSFSGVTRGEQTTATSFVTVRNDGATTTFPFTAGDLTFEYSGASRADQGTPTYVTIADPSIYVGVGGTLTLAPTAQATLPVRAAQIGAYGSAPANGIDLCITQSFGTLTVLSSTTAIGSEREPRPDYIARCLLAPDKIAPGGPTQAYRFAMNTTRGGDPLPRFDGSGPVTITQAYVSPDSANSEVTIYYGGAAGAVDAIDASSANANIAGTQLLDPVTGEDHNPDPVGCLPDTVLLLPTSSDPNTGDPGGASCINTVVRIHWSAKVKTAQMGSAPTGTYATPWLASTAYSVGQKVGNGTRLYVVTIAGTSDPSGGPSGTGSGIIDGGVTWNYAGTSVRPNTTATTSLFATENAALAAYMLSTGIGGLDQVAGVGVVYTADFVPAVKDAQAGLYDPAVSVPVGATTTIALGHIAVAPTGGSTGTITGVLVVV